MKLMPRRNGVETGGPATLVQLIAVLVVCGATAFAGQEPSPGTPSDSERTANAPATPADTVPPHTRYRIQRGDSLELTFPFLPTFNQAMTVQPDGFITLRGIGEQQAEGLTVSQLTEALRGRYTSILRDPVITVELRDFEKPYFVATGMVERPGKYELRGDTTLTQALAMAGGFRPRAKRTNVALFRRAPDGAAGVVVQEFNVKKLLDGRELANDPRLEPRDLLFVSKSGAPDMATFVNAVLPTLGWLTVIIQ